MYSSAAVMPRVGANAVSRLSYWPVKVTPASIRSDSGSSGEPTSTIDLAPVVQVTDACLRKSSDVGAEFDLAHDVVELVARHPLVFEEDVLELR